MRHCRAPLRYLKLFGIDDFISSVVGGGMKMAANAQQNEYNQASQLQAQQFNAQQANLNRAFSAQQADIARAQEKEFYDRSLAFNALQAQQGRDYGWQMQAEQERFNQQEAAEARGYNTMVLKDTQAYNSLEAQKARDFQERMSNTAYRRAMEDMKAAGLNPMLAYQQGGAFTGSGASASSSGSGGPAASAGQASGSTASSPSGRGISAGGVGNASISPVHMQSLFEGVMSSAMDAARASPALSKLKSEGATQDELTRRTKAEVETEKARRENVEKDTETKERMTKVAEGSRSRVGPGGFDPAYYGDVLSGVDYRGVVDSLGRQLSGLGNNVVTTAKRWWNMIGGD